MKWIATYKTPDGWLIKKRIEAENEEDAWDIVLPVLDNLLYDFDDRLLTVRLARKQEE